MTLQYRITGGQLKIDKMVFAKELLIPGNPIQRLLPGKNSGADKKSGIQREDAFVILKYNNSNEILLDEGFFDLFKKLKEKYREKIRGKVVIQITALTSYYVTLDLNSEDGKVVYE